MGKLIRYIAILTLLFVVGCSDDFERDAMLSSNNTVYDTLSVALEDDTTRTFLQSGNTLCWHAEDRLSVFYANTINAQYKFDGEDGQTEGTLSYISAPAGNGTNLGRIYAIYPYNATAMITTAGVISTQLPAEQQYATNTFGRGANMMVAASKDASNNSLSFKNVCGYLMLRLYGDATISSISLRGNSSESLAGDVKVAVGYGTTPELSFSTGASKELVLSCGDGVKLGVTPGAATQFIFVVPVTLFKSGFTVTIVDTKGRVYVKSTSKSVDIARNTIQPMAAFEPIFSDPLPEDNQIWYTTTNGAVVSFDSSDFGSAVASNVYTNGRGVITFKKSIERVGNNAFKNNTTLASITLPQSIKTIGNYAFSNCSSLTDIYLPEGLTTIGSYAFSDSEAFDVLTIPSTVTTFGARPFYHADANELVVNCSTPDADANLSPESMAFTETHIGKVTFTERVKRIGDYSFGWNTYITSISLGYGIEHIGEGAFCYNSSISSIAFPATVKSIGALSFYASNNLASVTSYATSVPELGEQAFPSSVAVYVPDASVMAYKSDTEWKKYMVYNLAGEEYQSTDFSEDGDVVILQRAERGNGIDIVLMGDGYSDRQIAAGYYEDDLSRAIDMLFTEEPYKSFRDLFNIYIVKCVSRYEGIVAGRAYGSTAFNCYFDSSSTQIKGDQWVSFDCARRVLSEDRIAEMTAIIILNSSEYGGTCYMMSPATDPNDNCRWGNGTSVSYFSLCGSDEMLKKLILHEAGGHGFGKLADEYFASTSGSVSYGDYYDGKYFEGYGWFRNVDYVYEEGDYIDESNVKWRHFLADERYKYDGLGVFEGAYTYAKNAYRPTDISIMRHNEGGYNAPSRESIYLRMHKLAYGNSWEYNYEAFVAYDAINRKSALQSATLSSVVYVEQPTHTPPVVVVR